MLADEREGFFSAGRTRTLGEGTDAPHQIAASRQHRRTVIQARVPKRSEWVLCLRRHPKTMGRRKQSQDDGIRKGAKRSARRCLAALNQTGRSVLFRLATCQRSKKEMSRILRRPCDHTPFGKVASITRCAEVWRNEK